MSLIFSETSDPPRYHQHNHDKPSTTPLVIDTIQELILSLTTHDASPVSNPPTDNQQAQQ